jgi:sugar lactone lactonase YvrE
VTFSKFKITKHILASVIALMAVRPVFAQVTAVATCSPAAPTPADMVTVNISLIGVGNGDSSFSVSYTLDGNASGTAAITTAATVVIPLGQPGPGRHVLSYTFPGDPYVPAATFSYSFQVSDTPFTYLGSSVMILYNTGDPGHVAIDSRDNAYFSDRSSNVVYKRDTHGNLTTFPAAGLHTPQGLAFDSADNLYIADQGNSRIVRVTPAGVQTTLPISLSSNPLNLTFDNSRQNLYITDMPAQAIYVFNLATSATTVYANNLYNIVDVAFDPTGTLYYSQHSSYSPGTLTRVQGGVATVIQTPLISPAAMVFDKAGTLYITDSASPAMWMLTPAGHFQQLEAGLGVEGLAMDSRGVIYIPAINSYAYSRQPAVFTNESIAFPAGGGFFAGGTSVSDASPTVYYTSSATEWLSSLTFPDASSPFRTYANVTCIANRLCYEPFVNSFVYPGPQTGYVVATSNLGTQLINPVYGIGVNSELAFNPGTISERDLTPSGSFVLFDNGDIFGVSTPGNELFFDTFHFGQENGFLPGSSQAPTQIAADGRHNIYYLESGTSRILRGSGAFYGTAVPDPTINSTVLFDLSAQTSLHTLTAFALDSATNLWIAGADATGNGTILFQDPAGNSKVFATGIGVPVAMVADEFGVLYSVDAGGTLRSFDSVGNTSIPASNLKSPLSIAVEPSGVVYVANGAGDLVEVKPDGSLATLPIAGVTKAAFVTLDHSGNLAVADNDTSHIFILNRTHSPGYSFSNVLVDTVSALSSQLINIGNQPLSFSSLPGSTPFVQSGTGNSCATSTVLAPGGQCDLNFVFHPTALQAYAQTGYITDGTGGASAANSQFAIPFTGTGVALIVTVPGTIIAEATSGSGAVVTFSASAADAFDGTDPVTCLPASGSTFPLGTTTVACSATDRAGHSLTRSFSITVQDTTPPVLTAPANITAAATGPNGAIVTYVVSATDLVSEPGLIGCTAASGSLFPLGTTTVSCHVYDNAGNLASKTFTVTVQDSAPPALTLPADITAAATGANGAAVSFTASATDAVDGVRPVICNPASGATFAIGTTTVTCSATDISANTATGTFHVTVNPSSTLITVAANVYSIGISVDGGVQTPVFPEPGLTVALSPGVHTIAVPQTQIWLNQSNYRYTFDGWSDGGAASHSITVGTSPAKYLATFHTQYLLTTTASPAAGGSVTASQFVEPFSTVSVTAVANAGYVFAGFSAPFSVPAGDPASFVLIAPTTVVANFTPLAPNLAASVGTRADAGAIRLVSLNLSNTGLGAATNAAITGITATVVLGTGAVAATSPLPVNAGTIAPGGTGSAAVLFNWPTTATKVKLTVTFAAANGYTGTSTITTLR